MNWEIAKLQTFGVEIEMTGLTRKKAAMIAAMFFETGEYRYIGTGYSTWAAIDEQGREWKFMSDSSIRQENGEAVELVTPILTYDNDIEMLQKLIRELRAGGAIANAGHDCGLHIHIGLGDHTGKSLTNLARLMASHEDLLVKAIGIADERLYGNRHHKAWCAKVDRGFLERLANKKPETVRGVQECWYDDNPDRHSGPTNHYDNSRYRMLNYHSIGRTGTIEFRMYQFDDPDGNKKNGLHAGVLRTYIQLSLVLSQQAKESRSITIKPVQLENEKFAMRTWMNRMGMIGPEFKTAHDILRRKLTGNSAFRYSD